MNDDKRAKFQQKRMTLTRRDMSRTHLLFFEYPEVDRPKTRKDCEFGPRPCPFVSCRHHLYLDANPSGSVTFAHGNADVDQIPETCALDVAGRGPHTLEEVGDILALTKERLRQIEFNALAKMRQHPTAAELAGAETETCPRLPRAGSNRTGASKPSWKRTASTRQ